MKGSIKTHRTANHKSTPRPNLIFTQAFTIVELLIVIVIIAILATFTAIAFNGVQQRAQSSAVAASLSQAAKKIALYNATNSAYPSILADAGVINSDVTFLYTGTSTNYCITGTKGTATLYLNNTSTAPIVGSCPAHSVAQNLWAPSNLPGLALWLDAADSATVLQTAGRVTSWLDKSGNNRNAAQGTVAMQPFWDTTQNGRSVIRFAGSQVLSSGDVLDLGQNGVTMWAVAKYDTGGEGSIAGKFMWGSEDGRWGIFRYTNNLYAHYDGNGKVSGDALVTDASTASRVLTLRLDRKGSGTTLNLRINGSATQTATYTDNGVNHDTTRPFLIGSYDAGHIPLTGWIAEIVVIMRPATAQELADVENYLSAKWGI